MLSTLASSCSGSWWKRKSFLTPAWMVGIPRLDAHGADAEFQVLEFLDLNVARQFVEEHGEVGTLHLAGEDVDESPARAFVTEDAQAALRLIDRAEKRQALDVIPM